MFFRRISENVKTQNWTAIGIDFLIVFIGVFVGIQASNWNEARQNESRTQNYYQRLLDDLESERLALQYRLQYLAVAEKYGEHALAALDDPEAMQSPQFLIALYQTSQIWTYSVQRATYDEILNSGIAETIPDPELRTWLANTFLNAEAMRQLIVAVKPYRDNIRLYMPHDVQTAVRENCGDQFERTGKSLLLIKLPDKCDIPFSKEQVRRTLESLQDYPSLKRELNQRLAAIEIKRMAIVANMPQIESLIQDIENRLTDERVRTGS